MFAFNLSKFVQITLPMHPMWLICALVWLFDTLAGVGVVVGVALLLLLLFFFVVVVVYYSLVFRIYTVNANVYVCCVSKLAVKIEGTKCKNLQKLLINEKVDFLLLFF